MNTPLTHADLRQFTHGPTIREVPPSRLATGSWSHELNCQIGEGDIHASYSADRVGMGQPMRRPFTYEGIRWICVGFRPGPRAEAYRLVHPAAFDGTPITYAEKVHPNGGKDARSDPMGFYHGMMVRSGGEQLVLCGPPVQFVAGQETQRSLFD